MSGQPLLAPRAKPVTADGYERSLAGGAVVLLGLVVIALVRGHADWGRLSPLVVAHMATVLPPLALTPLMLLRPRGDRSHRVLGWVWAVLMFASAAISFGVHGSGPGRLSPIHALSVLTVVTVPLLVFSARLHRVARHRRAARGLVTGALLFAGYFTLIPGRLLGRWLFRAGGEDHQEEQAPGTSCSASTATFSFSSRPGKKVLGVIAASPTQESRPALSARVRPHLQYARTEHECLPR